MSKRASTPFGQCPRDVLYQTDAADVGSALDHIEHGSKPVEVGRVRPEERIVEGLAELRAEFVQMRGIGVQVVYAPDRRVAAGVESDGGQDYKDVVLLYLRGIHHLGTLDDSVDEAGHVEIVIREHTGHLGVLAADKGTDDHRCTPWQYT